jgi:hypothetical protein
VTSRLQELARGRDRPREAPEEQCDLCAEPVAPEHRHLLDLESRRLLCACRACSILFDRSGAGGGHYRLVPDRVVALEDVVLDDATWQGFGIPVEMAFFFHSSAAGRVVAFYPSPLGATESLLDLAAWDAGVLADLEPDVEALLVNRTRPQSLQDQVHRVDRSVQTDERANPARPEDGTASGAVREHWIVPVDRCYELVGIVRTHWKGFTGGDELWRALDEFFDRLRKEATWQGSRSASRT